MAKKKVSTKKIIYSVLLALIIVAAILGIPKIISLFAQPTSTFTTTYGQLSDEQIFPALIIRKEEIVGKDVQRLEVEKPEGSKVVVNTIVAKSINSDVQKWEEQDKQLNQQLEQAIAQNNINVQNPESQFINSKIEKSLQGISKINFQSEILSIQKETQEDLVKKAKISGDLSKEGTAIKKILDEKEKLKQKVIESSKAIKANFSGVVSYRVDGYENKFDITKLGELTPKDIEGIEITPDKIIPQSSKNCKVVDGFTSYLGIVLTPQQAKKLDGKKEIPIRVQNNIIMAKIESLKEDKGKVLLILRVDTIEDVLLQYRKINVALIWWSQNGLKVSNKAIFQSGNQSYVVKITGGYSNVVPVRILYKTSDYSLIKSYNYSDFSKEDSKVIQDLPKVQEYDELVVNPKVSPNDIKKYQDLELDKKLEEFKEKQEQEKNAQQ